MKKMLLQNRINPDIKDEFHRYSKVIGIPMNQLIESFIIDGMRKGGLGLKQKLWKEFGGGEV
jgi:antitoxin component of RelBE/YafQ-DinJ toxin-antitoxin module